MAVRRARTRERLVVGGHSAGGHLAAMMLARDWRADGFATGAGARWRSRFPASTTCDR